MSRNVQSYSGPVESFCTVTARIVIFELCAKFSTVQNCACLHNGNLPRGNNNVTWIFHLIIYPENQFGAFPV